MEKKNESTDGTKQKLEPKLKEDKMEGISASELSGLLTQLKDGNHEDNWLKWILTIGLLGGGEGGIFGGRRGGEDAKLDCLQQGQQDAALAAVNTNMTNQHHSAEMSRHSDTARLASDFAECCCNLRAGQKDIVNEIIKCCCKLSSGHKDIVNEMCKQTGILTTAMTANTQRVVDEVRVHAKDETLAKLRAAEDALSNERQTNMLKETIRVEVDRCCSNNNDGHGRSG